MNHSQYKSVNFYSADYGNLTPTKCSYSNYNLETLNQIKVVDSFI